MVGKFLTLLLDEPEASATGLPEAVAEAVADASGSSKHDTQPQPCV